MSDLRRLVTETRVCVSQHNQNAPPFFIFPKSESSFCNVLSICTHNQNDGDSPCTQGITLAGGDPRQRMLVQLPSPDGSQFGFQTKRSSPLASWTPNAKV